MQKYIFLFKLYMLFPIFLCWVVISLVQNKNHLHIWLCKWLIFLVARRGYDPRTSWLWRVIFWFTDHYSFSYSFIIKVLTLHWFLIYHQIWPSLAVNLAWLKQLFYLNRKSHDLTDYEWLLRLVLNNMKWIFNYVNNSDIYH